MIKRILFIVVTLFSICCKDKKESIKPDSTIRVIEKIEKEKVKETPEVKLELTEWKLLDKNVFDNIDEIKKSNKNNRKELLQKFTSFSNKTDGALSEGYFGFAYDYPKNNFLDFFSVLQLKDSLLIDNWAKSASMELKLVMDNIDEPGVFFSELKNDYEIKISQMNSESKKAPEFYLKRLIKYSNNKQ